MLTLKVKPDAEDVRVSYSTDAPSGDDRAVEHVRGRLSEEELARGLVQVKGDVPVWLDSVWKALYP
jgi:hypothetical protein